MRRLSPGDPGAGAPRERDDATAPRRSASAATSARSSRASARRCSPCASRPAWRMWKNTWSAASSRRIDDRRADVDLNPRTLNPELLEPDAPHLRLVRPLQPLGLRAAVRADRRAAGVARSCEPGPFWDDSALARIVWIVVAMVAARSAAMGFNRLVDARHDALNPRTAMRELPRGAMTGARGGGVRRAASSLLFVFAAYRLGPLCFALSPVALAIVFWYSLAKRFTTYTQLFLGLAMAVAPVGGWLAAGGRAAGSRGCSVSRSAPGSAASTCSTPVRTSTSIARTACARFPCGSASRDRC